MLLIQDDDDFNKQNVKEGRRSRKLPTSSENVLYKSCVLFHSVSVSVNKSQFFLPFNAQILQWKENFLLCILWVCVSMSKL